MAHGQLILERERAGRLVHLGVRFFLSAALTAGQTAGGAAPFALGWVTAADILTIAFGVVSLYVFISVSEGRRKDKEAVSYNLLWGTGDLALLLCGCAVLTIRLRLGLQ